MNRTGSRICPKVGFWCSAGIVAGPRFGVRQDSRDHSLAYRRHARCRHSENTLEMRLIYAGTGIAGHQMLNQLLADERRHGRLRHQSVEHGFEILLRGLPGGDTLPKMVFEVVSCSASTANIWPK